ncbi:MAG TPA: hypothetical protein VLA61_21385 [Ideonella sp.]|uniref:hypothetical protein n=1 Tax=Ideonella sp. TaxID=1929293 RepID=UPI002C463CCD|nr:hypothetical protein [Ideonella sp.]HSI50828.1 hypothetical protein [Ideonella sp.]
MYRIAAAIVSAITCTAASALEVQSISIGQILTGNSSAFSDGVYLRVSGQVGDPNCYYAPFNTSIFYAKPNGVLDTKKALAMLMIAKLAGKTLNIGFTQTGVQTDFWGYGISQCEMQALILN